KVAIATKKLLVRDARERAVALRDCAPFFGFDELVHAMLPRAIVHDPPSVLIDYFHLAVRHDVLHVALKEMQCLKALPNQFLACPANDPKIPHARAQLLSSTCAARR